MFWFQMAVATVALTLILIGILHEEKLVAFENRVADRIGYHIAQVIIRHRKKKAMKLRAQRIEHDNRVAQMRRSQFRIVSNNTNASNAQNHKFIA